jgi:hypothetical protein
MDAERVKRLLSQIEWNRVQLDCGASTEEECDDLESKLEAERGALLAMFDAQGDKANTLTAENAALRERLASTGPDWRDAVIDQLREELRRAALLTDETIAAMVPKDAPWRRRGVTWIWVDCLTVGQLEDAIKAAREAKHG